MAITYSVNDAWDEATKVVGGTPVSEDLIVRAADKVASMMWTPYPWYRAKTEIAAASIPLTNGNQDYTAPTGIYRLLKGSLVCTSVTPNEWRELGVSQELDVNLRSTSPFNIRAISLQAGNILRLESAVQIVSGSTWEIRGEYQVNPTKITSVTDNLWFDDQYFPTFSSGILYFAMKYSNDPRAGGVQFASSGTATYAGQLAEFMSMLKDMKVAEDYGGVDGIFPSEAMGSGRDDLILNIFGVY